MIRSLFLVAALASATFCALPAAAQEPSVRGGFSGNWYSPAHDSQGLQIEVIDPRHASVAWYTFDDDGDPLWLFGVGTIHGNTIQVALDGYRGGRFPSAQAGDPAAEAWGEAEIAFADCTSAQLSWTTSRAGFEDGSLSLRRLSGIEGQRCGRAEIFQASHAYSFEPGPGPWSAVFADYSEAQADSIATGAGWTVVPFPLRDRNGFRLSGRNTSDDLAMFLKRPVAGLAPDTTYRVELDMTFATNVPQGCAGIGGPPGESVYVKLGASGTEPVVRNQGGDFRLNIDKGNQSSGGSDALVVGDMTNSQGEEICGDLSARRWQLKSVSTRGRDFTATTNGDGVLWIYGGSDSGFEGRTTFYVTDFTVSFSPVAARR